MKKFEESSVRLPAAADRMVMPLVIGGLVMLVAGVILGLMTVGARFAMGAYLTAYIYCVTIALGALFFVLIQHLCRAGWSVTVRRLAELLMWPMPWLAILFLPIVATLFIGDKPLYVWDSVTWVQTHHPEWQTNAKGTYLSDWFFTLRSALYLAIWCGLAWYFFRGSTRQDETAELRLTEKMQAWSGPGVILFSLSVTFAAFDWLMSLEPIWFSTMFGVYLFAGGILSALCAMTVMLFLMQRAGAMRQEVTVEHYHDFGKLIFGFVTFWTYIAFSQYLLIWYANIPEETFWFGIRQENGWEVPSLMLVFLHWLLPFLGLLSRHVRRRPTLMFGWSLFILVMHFVDMYWLVMPSVSPEQPLGGATGVLTTLLITLGMIGLYVGASLFPARRSPLVPIRDPRLGESLAFHNL